MNIHNTISINQDINIADLGLIHSADAVSKQAVGEVVDTLDAAVKAFSGLVEIIAECPSKNLDAEKLYFLLAQHEQAFSDALSEMHCLL